MTHFYRFTVRNFRGDKINSGYLPLSSILCYDVFQTRGNPCWMPRREF